MKIVRINELIDTEREVKGIGFTSIRALLKKDNMGFSMHKTIIPQGGPYNWHYKNHLEACYCIKGSGIVTEVSTGISTLITTDVVYVLDNYDNMTFEALEDVVLISVFNPPVTGMEVHKEDGSYDLDISDLLESNKSIAHDIVRFVNESSNIYDAVEYVESILNAKK